MNLCNSVKELTYIINLEDDYTSTYTQGYHDRLSRKLYPLGQRIPEGYFDGWADATDDVVNDAWNEE